jgi:hypothetical protein
MIDQIAFADGARSDATDQNLDCKKACRSTRHEDIAVIYVDPGHGSVSCDWTPIMSA